MNANPRAPESDKFVSDSNIDVSFIPNNPDEELFKRQLGEFINHVVKLENEEKKWSDNNATNEMNDFAIKNNFPFKVEKIISRSEMEDSNVVFILNHKPNTTNDNSDAEHSNANGEDRFVLKLVRSIPLELPNSLTAEGGARSTAILFPTILQKRLFPTIRQ